MNDRKKHPIEWVIDGLSLAMFLVSRCRDIGTLVQPPGSVQYSRDYLVAYFMIGVALLSQLKPLAINVISPSKASPTQFNFEIIQFILIACSVLMAIVFVVACMIGYLKTDKRFLLLNYAVTALSGAYVLLLGVQLGILVIHLTPVATRCII